MVEESLSEIRWEVVTNNGVQFVSCLTWPTEVAGRCLKGVHVCVLCIPTKPGPTGSYFLCPPSVSTRQKSHINTHNFLPISSLMYQSHRNKFVLLKEML